MNNENFPHTFQKWSDRKLKPQFQWPNYGTVAVEIVLTGKSRYYKNLKKAKVEVVCC